MNKANLVQSDDWEVLCIDGKLMEEGHTLGADLADEIWNLFFDLIPEKQEREYAQKLIDLFKNIDCDNMEECSFVQKIFYR
jgi:hypothetical protein